MVSGGAGFIGSHLCERLLVDGFDVLCVDNFYSSTRDNIAHLLDNPRFEIIRHDVTFPLFVEVDQIFHLACPASPVHYQRDPVQTTKTAVHGSINMLGLAKRTGARILLTSTSEVYGDPLVHPQSEDYWGNVNPIGPRLLRRRKTSRRNTVLRLSPSTRSRYQSCSTIQCWPRMHPNDGRVVSNFVVSALKAESLTVYGDGSQTRSFCYVSDLIEGLLALMNSSPDVTGPINLGNPGEFTIAELADLVIEMTDTSAGVTYLPLPTDDPTRRQPDITRANEQLQWSPTISLRDGLTPTIEYFRGAVID